MSLVIKRQREMPQLYHGVFINLIHHLKAQGAAEPFFVLIADNYSTAVNVMPVSSYDAIKERLEHHTVYLPDIH